MFSISQIKKKNSNRTLSLGFTALVVLFALTIWGCAPGDSDSDSDSSSPGESVAGKDWTQATAAMGQADFEYNNLVVFKDKLWTIGARDISIAPYMEHKNDIWNSSNGSTWAKVAEDLSFFPRKHFVFLAFNDKMWVMAGEEANPDDRYLYNDVWSSADGITWTEATSDAGFPGRKEAGGVVFDNKMWVIGGTTSDGTSDVWSSADGVTWVEATGTVFSFRQVHMSLVFDNKLWVINGRDDNDEYPKDVWSSSDGATWTLVTNSAAFDGRGGHALLNYNNKMWVIGGYNGPSGGVTVMNDVYSSTDGVTWTAVTSAAAFPKRLGHGAVVFNNKMWILGGNNGTEDTGDLFDVWYSP